MLDSFEHYRKTPIPDVCHICPECGCMTHHDYALKEYECPRCHAMISKATHYAKSYNFKDHYTLVASC